MPEKIVGLKGVKLFQGDMVEVLAKLPDNSVYSIVTDCPYGIAFMSRKWDYDVPSVEAFQQCLRVLKPGGHLLCFASTRTSHRITVNIEDAGFEIRDTIAWVYSSGMPKGQHIGKAIDKKLGKDRKSDLAKQWEGWHSGLKPAFEPITVARKPFKGSLVANVMKHGVGGLNIDDCRVPTDETITIHSSSDEAAKRKGIYGEDKGVETSYQKPGQERGRFPANFIHDGSPEVLGLFPHTKSGYSPGFEGEYKANIYGKYDKNRIDPGTIYADEGSAARFFYCSKASKKDRTESGQVKNNHITIKPTDLMRYLCRLVTPPGGIVLDPYMGSGSTGKAAILEGFRFMGVELEPDSFQTAVERITITLQEREEE